MGVLVGREREIARLSARLERAADGRGGVTIVRGEAGIGKTALARWVADEGARQGFRVIVGRAHPSGKMISYGPIVEAFGRALRALDDGAIAALTDRIVGLSALFPGLVDEPELPSLPDDLALTRTLEAIRGLFVRLAAAQPIVLVVDDVQWADPATLRTLTHLAAELDGAPAVVVLTMRAGEDADRPDVRTTLAALRRVTDVDELAPARLDATETAVMLSRLDEDGLSADLIAEVVERSAGTPLFVEALGRELLERQRVGTPSGGTPPAAVNDAIGERLDGISADARAVLTAVSLAAAELDPATARIVSGLDDASFETAVAELLSRHLLSTSTGIGGVDLEVAHPVIAEVIEASMTPPERSRTHLALLDAVGERVDAEVAAVHVAGAAERVDPERAIDVFRAAANQALRRQAYRSVASHAGRALDLARRLGRVEDQLDLADQLARALFGLGELDAAEAVTREALALDPPSQRLLLPALMRAEVLAWLRGDGEAELAAFERVIDSIPQGDVGLDVARAFEHRLTTRARRKQYTEMRAVAADIQRRFADRPEPQARVMHLLGEAYMLEIDRRASQVQRVVAELAEIASCSDLRDQVHRARLLQLDATMITGPIEAIRRAATAASGHTSMLYMSWRDHIADYVCRLATLDPGWLEDDALAHGERPTRTDLPPRPNPIVPAHRAWVAGDRDGIATLLTDLASDGVARPGVGPVEVAAVEGFQALILSDRDAARSTLELVAGRAPQAATELLLEELTTRLGMLVGDDETVERSLSFMRQQDDGDGWASAHAALMEAEREPDPARAAAQLTDAADRFFAVGDRRHVAECLTLAAARDEAALDRPRLAALVGPVSRAGLDDLAARMRTVLGEADRPSAPPSSSLTARQLEIAELVAEGLTNAAIADRLFISVRTVTSHLDHIYTRLGIANRTELAVRLPDLRD